MPMQNFFPLFQQEKKSLDRKLAGRQDDVNRRVASIIPMTVLGALLGFGVGQLLIQSTQPPQLLQDHPMCGITTGGQVRLLIHCTILGLLSPLSHKIIIWLTQPS